MATGSYWSDTVVTLGIAAHISLKGSPENTDFRVSMIKLLQVGEKMTWYIGYEYWLLNMHLLGTIKET